jgi:cytochrome c-type biogenesis protein CcmH/NrfF
MTICSRAPVRVVLAALLAAVLSAPQALNAQAANERPVRGIGAEARHPEAARAIDELKSPYCPGLMLEVCPSGGGQALRDTLQALAEEGWTSDAIVDWVVANHGEEYRAMPKRSGASLLMAWVIPPAAAVLGLVLVVVALRRMRGSGPVRAPAQGALSSDEEARLREALRELDAEEEASLF